MPNPTPSDAAVEAAAKAYHAYLQEAGPAPPTQANAIRAALTTALPLLQSAWTIEWMALHTTLVRRAVASYAPLLEALERIRDYSADPPFHGGPMGRASREIAREALATLDASPPPTEADA